MMMTLRPAQLQTLIPSASARSLLFRLKMSAKTVNYDLSVYDRRAGKTIKYHKSHNAQPVLHDAGLHVPQINNTVL